MLEVAVLYGCDLSQVFTPIILRLYQPHSLCEKGATRAAAKAALYVFLLPPLREGRPQLYPGANILVAFLLTPLREGRPFDPAEGIVMPKFLLAPLREGRPAACGTAHSAAAYFYSPTRGATYREKPYPLTDEQFLLAPLHEGRLREIFNEHFCLLISTRAPTRGATAFFHKTIS